MRLTSTWPSIVLLCGLGCVTLRDRLSRARGTPVVLVDRAKFDGVYLSGRLLVSAEDAGYVIIDRRMAEHAIIVVDEVFDCDGGSTVDYIAADSVITPPRDDDLLCIEPGYWFGHDFSLFVYEERIAKVPPPECLEALVAVNFKAAGPDGGKGRPALRVRAHLTRPDGDAGGGASSPDAGVPMDLPHIFRQAPGHFVQDTAAARELIQTTVTEASFVGTRPDGDRVYARLLDTGAQIWAFVYNGTIRNGGRNDVPWSVEELIR